MCNSPVIVTAAFSIIKIKKLRLKVTVLTNEENIVPITRFSFYFTQSAIKIFKIFVFFSEIGCILLIRAVLSKKRYNCRYFKRND